MRILSLQISNIGIIADTTIKLDKPLLIFYGECRAGKSTILSSVRWAFGGAFPQDIIRHGSKEAFVEIVGSDGTQPIIIRREWYVSKDGTTKAREVTFTRNGRLVDKPVSELKRWLNPFMLDQDHFRNMTEVDRKKFMVELFGVDTAELDSEWTKNDRAASDLRAKVKGYGEIDLTPVERVDLVDLQSKLAGIRTIAAKELIDWEKEVAAAQEEHQKTVRVVMAGNAQVRELKAQRARAAADIVTLDVEIAELQKRIEDRQAQKRGVEVWLSQHPEQAETPEPAAPALKARPAAPDTAALEAKIQEAGAVNVRAEQFEKNKARAAARTADEKALKALEDRQRAIKAEKIAKLAGVSKDSGVVDLAFGEDGNFTFEGVAAGMLSTSQVMRLSSQLSALYPEGFSLELLDRAESLGRSVFEYVKLATDKKITVMATVVGQKPANVPERVGVFVVADGVVIPDEAK